MTPKEFLKTKRPINSEYQLERLLQEYAKFMCKKQKEICAEEAKRRMIRQVYHMNVIMSLIKIQS